MPIIHFYFDFVSPYAYVAFHALPRTLAGLPYQVVHRPLVLGALLKAHGTPVPVSLPPAWLVLVNPGVPVPTGAVFARLASRDNPPLDPLPAFADSLALAKRDLLARWIDHRVIPLREAQDQIMYPGGLCSGDHGVGVHRAKACNILGNRAGEQIHPLR